MPETKDSVCINILRPDRTYLPRRTAALAPERVLAAASTFHHIMTCGAGCAMLHSLDTLNRNRKEWYFMGKLCLFGCVFLLFTLCACTTQMTSKNPITEVPEQTESQSTALEPENSESREQAEVAGFTVRESCAGSLYRWDHPLCRQPHGLRQQRTG